VGKRGVDIVGEREGGRERERVKDGARQKERETEVWREGGRGGVSRPLRDLHQMKTIAARREQPVFGSRSSVYPTPLTQRSIRGTGIRRFVTEPEKRVLEASERSW